LSEIRGGIGQREASANLTVESVHGFPPENNRAEGNLAAVKDLGKPKIASAVGLKPADSRIRGLTSTVLDAPTESNRGAPVARIDYRLSAQRERGKPIAQ
jgi:hypothetical protein